MRAPSRGMVFIDDGALSKSQRILENYQTTKTTENVSLKLEGYQSTHARTPIQCSAQPVTSAPATKGSSQPLFGYSVPDAVVYENISVTFQQDFQYVRPT